MMRFYVDEALLATFPTFGPCQERAIQLKLWREQEARYQAEREQEAKAREARKLEEAIIAREREARDREWKTNPLEVERRTVAEAIRAQREKLGLKPSSTRLWKKQVIDCDGYVIVRMVPANGRNAEYYETTEKNDG